MAILLQTATVEALLDALEVFPRKARIELCERTVNFDEHIKVTVGDKVDRIFLP